MLEDDASQYNFSFQIQITNRCDLSCLHCYSDTKTPYDLDPEAVLDWISNATFFLDNLSILKKIRFSYSFSISGGEPTIYDKLPYFLAKLHNLGGEVHLLSNGVSRSIRSLPFDLIDTIQISVDGDETTHDSLRGIGTFERAVNTIKFCIRNDINYSINTVLTLPLIKNFDKFTSLLDTLKVKSVNFKRYIPAKRDDQLSITSDDFKNILATIRKHGIWSTDDPLFTSMHQNSGGCSVGIWGIFIRSDGSILPCSKLNIPVGNIFSDSFEDVWTRSEVLTNIRNQKKYIRCNECQLWKKCRGCRAFSYINTGDYLGPDDFCLCL